MKRSLSTFAAAGLVIGITGCATPSPVPSPLATTAGPATPSPTAIPTIRSEPMSMDELRAAYEAQGLECSEYAPFWGPGTNLGCETMVGTGLLLIEATYTPDDQLLRLISTIIVPPPRDPPTAVAPADRMRAIEIVLAVDYPGHDPEATGKQLQEWVRAGGCERKRCEVRSGTGRWILRIYPAEGWQLRLDLDDDPTLR